MKFLAQKALRSYLRSVFLMSNKDVFDVANLPVEEFAGSYGLVGVPKIKFLKGKKVDKSQAILDQKMKDIDRMYKKQVTDDQNEEEEVDMIVVKKPRKEVGKIEKLLKQKNMEYEHRAKLVDSDEARVESEDDSDDVLRLKRGDEQHTEINEPTLNPVQERIRQRVNKRIAGVSPLEEDTVKQPYIERIVSVVQDEDVADKARERQLKREKKREKRLREKEERREEHRNNAMGGAVLVPPTEDEVFEYSDQEEDDNEQYDEDNSDENEYDDGEMDGEDKSESEEPQYSKFSNKKRKRGEASSSEESSEEETPVTNKKRKLNLEQMAQQILKKRL